jgi:oxaloacetate decarboxylase alpha subunit/pyruvate carboxylase subunit B
MSHLKAIEAGVDIIDTCMTPYAYRTSHAAIEPLVMALLGTNRDTGFDINLLAEINVILEKEVLPKYKHLLDDSKVSIIDINVLLHQTPGGMLSNLVNQLRELDALDKIDDVYHELPRVRKELGQIPLVTPTSQIVGIQTVNNVLFDDDKERYKMITDQVKDLCYGLYGKTAVPIDKEVQKKALKNYSRGNKPIEVRPAEVLEPELEKAKDETRGLAVDLDDVLIYALYPVTGKRFLKWKYGKDEPPAEVRPRTLEQAKQEEEMVKKARAGQLVEKSAKKQGPPKSDDVRTFNVYVGDEYFEVGVDEVGESPVLSYIQQMPAMPAGQMMPPMPAAAPAQRPAAPAAAPAVPVKEEEAAAPAPAAAEVEGTPLIAPMPGMIVNFQKNVGDEVSEGETVVILEAMKMENALPAPAGGTIKAINFSSGDSVQKNDVLAIIG